MKDGDFYCLITLHFHPNENAIFVIKNALYIVLNPRNTNFDNVAQRYRPQANSREYNLELAYEEATILSERWDIVIGGNKSICNIIPFSFSNTHTYIHTYVCTYTYN